MQASHGQFYWLRLAIALALAAVGQLPAAASADPRLTGIGSASPELIWTSPLTLPDSGESPTLASFGVFADELFAAGERAPGLEFSLSPEDEEILLGWRFEF